MISDGATWADIYNGYGQLLGHGVIWITDSDTDRPTCSISWKPAASDPNGSEGITDTEEPEDNEKAYEYHFVSSSMNVCITFHRSQSTFGASHDVSGELKSYRFSRTLEAYDNPLRSQPHCVSQIIWKYDYPGIFTEYIRDIDSSFSKGDRGHSDYQLAFGDGWSMTLRLFYVVLQPGLGKLVDMAILCCPNIPISADHVESATETHFEAFRQAMSFICNATISPRELDLLSEEGGLISNTRYWHYASPAVSRYIAYDREILVSILAKIINRLVNDVECRHALGVMMHRWQAACSGTMDLALALSVRHVAVAFALRVVFDTNREKTGHRKWSFNEQNTNLKGWIQDLGVTEPSDLSTFHSDVVKFNSCRNKFLKEPWDRMSIREQLNESKTHKATALSFFTLLLKRIFNLDRSEYFHLDYLLSCYLHVKSTHARLDLHF